MALNNSIDSNFNALTAGGGISLSNTNGNVTVSTTSSAALLPLTIISINGVTLSSNNRYLVELSGGGTINLPSTFSRGDIIEITLGNTTNGTLTISNGAVGQSVYFMGIQNTPGVSGNIKLSLNASITFIGETANTIWVVKDFTVSPGNGIGVT